MRSIAAIQCHVAIKKSANFDYIESRSYEKGNKYVDDKWVSTTAEHPVVHMMIMADERRPDYCQRWFNAEALQQLKAA